MPRQVGSIRAWAEVAALGPPWALLRALPLERAVRVGAALGSVAMALDRFNRPIARRNLQIAFPEDDDNVRRRILLGMYRNFGRMAAEWVRFPGLSRQNIASHVTYTGREHWDEA